MNERFYQKNWFIILMLVFICPLGIYLLFKCKKFTPIVRYVLSVASVLILAIALLSPKDNIESQSTLETTSISSKENIAPLVTITPTPVTEPLEATPTPTEVPTITPTAIDDIQAYATECVNSVFGEDDVITVKYIEVTNFLSIEANGSENLTDKLTLRGMYLDIETLLKDFSQLENININFDIYYSFIDIKGNESDEIAIRARYDWDNVNDVNWDNFLTPNIPNIATSWSVHPAFSDIVIE